MTRQNLVYTNRQSFNNKHSIPKLQKQDYGLYQILNEIRHYLPPKSSNTSKPRKTTNYPQSLYISKIAKTTLFGFFSSNPDLRIKTQVSRRLKMES
jgi:hypothetical protein